MLAGNCINFTYTSFFKSFQCNKKKKKKTVSCVSHNQDRVSPGSRDLAVPFNERATGTQQVDVYEAKTHLPVPGGICCHLVLMSSGGVGV